MVPAVPAKVMFIKLLSIYVTVMGEGHAVPIYVTSDVHTIFKRCPE